MVFGMDGHWSVLLCVFTTWRQLWGFGAGCPYAHLSPQGSPTAGFLVPLGRRLAGVGRGRLVLLPLGLWPVLSSSSLCLTPHSALTQIFCG